MYEADILGIQDDVHAGKLSGPRCLETIIVVIYRSLTALAA